MAGTFDADDDRLRIGELSERTGVAVPTLRAWERRYRLLEPARSPGGHRWYSAADIGRVAHLRRLVAGGLTVAAAARTVVAASPDRLGIEPAGQPDPVEAALAATRTMLWVESAAEVVDALVAFVVAVGGTVSPADRAAPTALPLDLSFGEREPLLADAGEYGVARLHLERLLPALVEDARHVISGFRSRRGRMDS